MEIEAHEPCDRSIGWLDKRPGLVSARAAAIWDDRNTIFCDVWFPTRLSLLAVAESARGRGLSFAAASQVINACGSVPRVPFAPVARLHLQAFWL